MEKQLAVTIEKLSKLTANLEKKIEKGKEEQDQFELAFNNKVDEKLLMVESKL
jgi:hypothetical protein